MADQWFVVVDEQWRERSVGTVIAQRLPDGWQAIPLVAKPDYDQVEWAAVQRAYVPRIVPAPVPVRMDWTTIENAPATYPPAAHSHDWAQVQGKPATFPPDLHAHDYSSLANRPTLPLMGASATPATTGAQTVPMDTAVKTITPTGACTFNAGAAGSVGDLVTFEITTSGAASFTLTFGTGFRRVGTLATGTTNARFFAVTFRCVAPGVWSEIGRTAAKT